MVVHNFDTTTIDEAGLTALCDAFEEPSGLLLRDQNIDEDAHICLARFFGEIEDRYADEHKKGETVKVPDVTNILDDGALTGEMYLHKLNPKFKRHWHIDRTFFPVPALINIEIGRW